MKELKALESFIFRDNEFRRIAAKVVAETIEKSKPFIGKKIDTLKGLAQKFADVVSFDREQMQSIKVNPVPGTEWANVHRMYVSVEGRDLTIEVSLCFSNGSGSCFYNQQRFYFGKVENSILQSINEIEINTTPIVLAEEVEKIKRLRLIQKEAEEIEDTIRVMRDAYRYLHLEDLK